MIWMRKCVALVCQWRLDTGVIILTVSGGDQSQKMESVVCL